MPASFVDLTGVQGFVLLLVMAAAVSIVSRRLALPYTVSLVVVGVAIGFFEGLPRLELSRDVVLLLFLPPLLFEGSLAMDAGLLRANWREVSLLALGVTAACCVLMGVAAHFTFGYAWPYAFLVGVVLAPTDPVAVLALMRESRVTRRLSLLIEAESCFNDAIGVVLFVIVIAVIVGQPLSVPEASWLFVRQAVGGALVGGVLGGLVHALLTRIDDHLTETMISLALAYGAYVAAEQMHFSGLMAVIVGGLIMGSYGKTAAISEETRRTLSAFWEVVAFLANSVLFLLMGVALQSAPLRPHGLVIGVAFVLLLACRQAAVLAAVALMRRMGCDLPRGWCRFIGWGGLRGSIPIALGLGLAPWPAGPGVPSRDELIALVFGVVLLSLLVQGLTVRPLLLGLGLGEGQEGAPAGH